MARSGRNGPRPDRGPVAWHRSIPAPVGQGPCRKQQDCLWWSSLSSSSIFRARPTVPANSGHHVPSRPEAPRQWRPARRHRDQASPRHNVHEDGPASACREWNHMIALMDQPGNGQAAALVPISAASWRNAFPASIFAVRFGSRNRGFTFRNGRLRLFRRTGSVGQERTANRREGNQRGAKLLASPAPAPVQGSAPPVNIPTAPPSPGAPHGRGEG